VLATIPMDIDLPSLHTIIIGGQAPTKQLIDYWTKKVQVVMNCYGPTEITVNCSYKLFYKDKQIIPTNIGRPYPNTKLYILNSNLQPVPIGMPGELYIGGIGVARGYLNRDELTK